MDNTFHVTVHILHYRILQFDCVWGDRSGPGWRGGRWARLSCLRHRYCLSSSSPHRSIRMWQMYERMPLPEMPHTSAYAMSHVCDSCLNACHWGRVGTGIRALSPYMKIQVTMTMSGRSRHLHSNVNECKEHMLRCPSLELRWWSLPMS